jgi:hypothetical protein
MVNETSVSVVPTNPCCVAMLAAACIATITRKAV